MTLPESAELAQAVDIHAFAGSFDTGKILIRQGEELAGGSEAAFLDVDKRTGELDEALIKLPEQRSTRGEPDYFEHFMRLIKFLPIEREEVGGVMRIPSRRDSGSFFQQRGDALSFGVHAD